MPEQLRLRLENIWDFEKAIAGQLLRGIFVDFDCKPLVAAWRPRPGGDAVLSSWARELGMPYEVELCVWFLDAGEWRCRPLDGPAHELAHVQRTPHGWLSVDARGQEPEHNALLYDELGRRVGDFHAGDAISSVQVTRDGKVWIANFDEMYSERSELAEGLICVDLLGRPMFRFSHVISEQVPQIDDCYALNVVSDGETWATYYSDFPIVKLTEFEVEGVWPARAPAGSHAFAVHETRLLFGPDYRGQCWLVDLGVGARKRVRFEDPEGRGLNFRGNKLKFVARGRMAYVLSGSQLLRIDLAEL